ncbi:MAG: hypothetical protein LUF89_01920 [Ruminococcus sp.]|nr:hypothetical protein [Ruminococcus sp.]
MGERFVGKGTAGYHQVHKKLSFTWILQNSPYLFSVRMYNNNKATPHRVAGRRKFEVSAL